MLTSAAREGVRVAAVTAPDAAQVNNAAQNILNAGQVRNANISIQGPNSQNEVSVTISLNYRPMSGVVIPGLSSVRITRSTTMRWEG